MGVKHEGLICCKHEGHFCSRCSQPPEWLLLHDTYIAIVRLIGYRWRKDETCAATDEIDLSLIRDVAQVQLPDAFINCLLIGSVYFCLHEYGTDGAIPPLQLLDFLDHVNKQALQAH